VNLSFFWPDAWNSTTSKNEFIHSNPWNNISW
jgi:hypothetical protein